jgi:hypothetical protein
MTRISKDFRNRANAPLGRSLVHPVVVQDETLLLLAEIDIEVLAPTSSRRRHPALANGIVHVAQVEPPSANSQFHISENDRRFPI